MSLAIAWLAVAGSGCASAPAPGYKRGPQTGTSSAAVGGSGSAPTVSQVPNVGSGGVATAGNAALPSAGASGTSNLPGAVGQHGALHVMHNRVVDASGSPLQLRGMSLFWSQWSSYYKPNTVDQLADDWHATLVRAVLGVENDGGYLASPSDNETKVLAIVDRAIARGSYVIVDWHDQHAQDHQAAAIDFFTRMAKKYGATPAVLFEIYNEPLKVDWPTIKAYAEAVISAIRGAGASNLVIVGTPTWSQDVDIAAADPITDFADVAYTLHFYAATHKQYLRDKAQRALDAGLPLFVTEWGACEASGDGMLDPTETQTWLDFLARNSISWANWSLNDKAESCSALAPGAGTTGPWVGNALTTSGMLVKAALP